MAATPPEGIAGTATRHLLEDQISEERERRTSLETRGASVITSGGVVVAFIIGVAAAFVDPKTLTVPNASIVLIGVSLGALVVAAAFAILVVLPTRYEGVDPLGLARLVEPRWWNAAFGPTDRRTAEAQLEVLISLRDANKRKAIRLTIALALEAASVIALGVAAGFVVNSR